VKYTSDEALRNWFAYHPPSTPDIVVAHEFVRERYGSLAQYMNSLLPEGPDKTVALRAIRDASMQANAAIACAQKLHPEAESVLNSPIYVDVIADPGSIARLKRGIEAALTAAFGDIITAEQLAVFNETFAATIGMDPEAPNA
jgi:hypothetical protein